MTNVPKRLAVKFNLARPSQLQPADIMPIFQRWIQQRTVPGMLIDVIDYKHVPDGPGIVLVADEADYAWDLGGGRVGLRYIRKRALPDDLSAALRLCFACAWTAAQALEAEAPGTIAFDYHSAEISYLDRLQYANEPALAAQTQAALATSLPRIFGFELQLQRLHDDPRFLLAFRCESPLPLTASLHASKP
ncbi:MAG: hypothetical protein OXG92_03980 [Chloroflexi bacterium]|nr:hypothetical protein [Chloroflexota bacterium]MCY3581108.1 hypothetical protein [Chloroflexota bacterium]MCY3715615.1 hypothetical protein [Chloroflexota bacterium]MDE2650647.1 hypothetical protein [Chloroflexota bacterium]MXX51254.1 hypothetical protein [Chloroflexota bacterium]